MQSYIDIIQIPLYKTVNPIIVYLLVSFILQTLNIDIVDKFLLELDTFDADNCKPGTETLLSEGVVQQYGRTRFRFVWRIIVFL